MSGEVAASSWREKTWRFLNAPAGLWARSVQGLLATLVVLAAIVVGVEIWGSVVDPDLNRALAVFQWVTVSIFATEYFVRLAAAPRRKEYAFSFGGLVDLVAFAPSLLMLVMGVGATTVFLRLLRIARFVPSLKLLRYSSLRIRTKIFVGFFASTLLVLLPSLLFVYDHFTDMKEREVKTALLGQVVVASRFFTAEQLLAVSGEDDPKYVRLQRVLADLRDRLRQSGIPVRYVYTMKKSAGDPTKLVYLVDAEIGRSHSEFGSVYDTVAMNAQWCSDFRTARAAPDFDYDDDGKTLVLSAQAPLPSATGDTPVVLMMDVLADDVQRVKRTVALLVIGMLLASVLITMLLSGFMSAYFNRPIRELMKGIEAIERQDFDYEIRVVSGDELGEVGVVFNERLFLVLRDFFRFMYAPVARMLMGPEREGLMEGKYEHVSVLFTDFKGFTAMSSLYAPRQVVEFLNAAFSILEATVTRRGGIIDKHIGDALMVYFLPRPGEDNTARRAVECALEMQSEYDHFFSQRSDSGELVCALRVGVHSGDVVLGAIGAEKLEVTVIGHTVNLANRMESAAVLGGVGISPETAAQGRVRYWLHEHPGWELREEKVDVKHLKSLAVVQLTRADSAQAQPALGHDELPSSVRNLLASDSDY